MLSALPMNAGIGPISTLLTLEILEQKGGAIEVAYVITLGNVVNIPASIFWGMMADRYNLRKIIIFCFGICSLLVSLLYIAFNIIVLATIYSLISFFSVAYNTPMNLLIMSSVEKAEWAESFSRLSFMSSTGVLLGTVISSLSTLIIGIREMFLVLSALIFSSFLIAIRKLPRPPITFERVAILHKRESFITRLKMFPIFFAHHPVLNLKVLSINYIRKRLLNDFGYLYLSIFTFYISSGIFNTLYPASLYIKGLSDSTTLGVIAFALLVQILMYRRTGKVISDNGEKKAMQYSLILRGVSYSLIGIITQLFEGLPILISGLTLYPLAAGIAFAIYNTSSSIAIFNVVGERKQGTSLGIYSTLVGIALFTGSFLSGYIAHFLGYGADFIVAGLILFISLKLLKKYNI